jgi:hypothetical protein
MINRIDKIPRPMNEIRERRRGSMRNSRSHVLR